MNAGFKLAFEEMRAHNLKPNYAHILDQLETDERMIGAWPDDNGNEFQILEAILHAKITVDEAVALEKIDTDGSEEINSLIRSKDNLSKFFSRLDGFSPKPGEIYDPRVIEFITEIPSIIQKLDRAGYFLDIYLEGFKGVLSPILSSSRKKEAHQSTVFCNRLCTLFDKKLGHPAFDFVATVSSVLFDPPSAELRQSDSVQRAWNRDRQRRNTQLT